MSGRRQREEGLPDIQIGAAARARRLRFRRKPKTDVRVEGGTRVRSDRGVEELEVESDSHTERRNLPEEVEPGVTYRDVEVGWIAEGRVRSTERDEDEDKESN